MSTFFSQNIAYLRRSLPEKPSQDKLATELGLKKSTLAAYEGGRAEPKYSDLVRFAEFFGVSTDDLLRKELSREQPTAPVLQVVPNDFRVLVTTVDKQDRENIEFVPVKAVAGYTQGYNNEEYISALPVFQVPFLPDDRKYRVFPITGDSMPPLREGAMVFAEYVENWKALRNGTICVVVTRDEGVVLKKVFNYLEDKKSLVLASTNERYKPYPVLQDEIQEIWRFAGFFERDFPSS
jgi:phage repressor protein C with HTH and peptisase S24 domain